MRTMNTITNPDNKSTVLGSALWGWAVDRKEAFAMMDRYAERGGRIIDCASNYPINRQPKDYGIAEQWIYEWLRENASEQTKVWMKVGAIDNLGSPANDLSASRLEQLLEHYRNRFDASLGIFAIHWDDRDRREEIDDSLAVISDALAAGIGIGFSGLKHPALYAGLRPGLAGDWWIQVKENIASSQARKKYFYHFPKARYFAYGINMGGVKLEPAAPESSTALRGVVPPSELVDALEAFLNSDHGLKPKPQNLNELALARTYLDPGLSGVILGPRNVRQLDASLEYWHRLRQESQPGMYEAIAQLSASLA